MIISIMRPATATWRQEAITQLKLMTSGDGPSCAAAILFILGCSSTSARRFRSGKFSFCKGPQCKPQTASDPQTLYGKYRKAL